MRKPERARDQARLRHRPKTIESVGMEWETRGERHSSSGGTCGGRDTRQYAAPPRGSNRQRSETLWSLQLYLPQQGRLFWLDSYLAVVDEHPVAELLGHAVGGAGVERSGLLLGDLLHLSVQLRGRRLSRPRRVESETAATSGRG